MSVHGRKAVAPLKRLRLQRRRQEQPSVHGRKAVAPLKLVVAAAGAGGAAPSTAARPWPH